MNEVGNLARIVTSRALHSLPVLDLQSGQATKEHQFVSALLATPDATQHQMVKALYGKNTLHNTRAFQKLQSRVRAKMLNHLFFLDHSDPRFLVSRRYQNECLDLLHKISVLFAEGEYALTERLLKRCLTMAQKGDFTQYVVQCARMLTTLYAQLRQPRAFDKMDKLLQEAQRVQALEDEGERLYTRTQLALASTVVSRRQVLPLLPEHLDKLESLHRRAGTFNTYNYLYRLRLAFHELQGNYAEIIRLTGLASKQLRDGKLNERRFDKRYNHFMTVFAHLRSRQPLKGLKLAQLAVQDFHPSSSNWLFFQENHVLLALHAKDYEYAQVLLSTVIKNPSYSKQRPAALERWDLYIAYSDFVHPSARTRPSRRAAMARWALTVTEFSRDKSGLNVAILVLQLLYFMRDGNYEEIMVRLERLRKYQQRHMNGTGMLRSKLFLRLLRVMVDQGFNAKKSAEKGKPLLEELHNTNPPGEADAEIEIIPYEHLWTLIISMLHEQQPMLYVPWKRSAAEGQATDEEAPDEEE
jgi:hypothetical protein